MAWAVYVNGVFNKMPVDVDIPDLNRKIARIRLCQEFPGWTLEYVDHLLENDPFTVAEIWGILKGQNDVRENEARRARVRRH